VHPGASPDDFEADVVLAGFDLAGANPGADTWAVVATMGHYDEDALEAALAYPAVEVGLIASTRRAAAVRDGLRSRGMDEATVDRIRAPAGTVRSGSQEEIPLTSQHKAMYEDATYWFCSAGCQAEFEREPKRYLRPIEA
jgi:xanthine dehydrogenase accessory factor